MQLRLAFFALFSILIANAVTASEPEGSNDDGSVTPESSDDTSVTMGSSEERGDSSGEDLTASESSAAPKDSGEEYEDSDDFYKEIEDLGIPTGDKKAETPMYPEFEMDREVRFD